jgi:hypothetical protein
VLDWKKFDDEVPTEPRHVLVCGKDGGLLMLCQGESRRQRTNEKAIGWVSEFASRNVWIELNNDEMADQHCREEAWRSFADDHEATHWQHIDLPEAT